MRTALIIAFHFPPVASSSGVHRTHKLVQYLPQFGWRPLVVTPSTRVHERVADADPALPDGTVVRRTFALDSARHLSIAGRYVSATAVPDRWVTWAPSAVLAAVSLWRRYRPDVMWSTYPIATTHLVATLVKRLTGLPWIADFRDPMTEETYPPDPRTWRTYRRIEQAVMRRCDIATFVTSGCRDLYAERYGADVAARFRVVENGFDEEDFAAAEAGLGASPPVRERGAPLRVVHAGVLYPDERDPRPLFAALARLKQRGVVSPAELRIVLRASGHDDYHARLIGEAGIGDLVELAPGVPYAQALREMLASDALLLMQGANCNQQIPAKAYEYLRAGRPILALADPEGDTGRLLRSVGVEAVCAMEDSAAIERTIEGLLPRLRDGSAGVVSRDRVARYSRLERCKAMAEVFDSLCDGAGVQPRQSGGGAVPGR